MICETFLCFDREREFFLILSVKKWGILFEFSTKNCSPFSSISKYRKEIRSIRDKFIIDFKSCISNTVIIHFSVPSWK